MWAMFLVHEASLICFVRHAELVIDMSLVEGMTGGIDALLVEGVIRVP